MRECTSAGKTTLACATSRESRQAAERHWRAVTPETFGAPSAPLGANAPMKSPGLAAPLAPKVHVTVTACPATTAPVGDTWSDTDGALIGAGMARTADRQTSRPRIICVQTQIKAWRMLARPAGFAHAPDWCGNEPTRNFVRPEL